MNKSMNSVTRNLKSISSPRGQSASSNAKLSYKGIVSGGA
jgi:hypothetical protein